MMPDETNAASSNDRKGNTTSYLWHCRLGHIGNGGLSDMGKKNYGTGINIKSVNKWELCDGCAFGKQTRVNFAKYSPNHVKKASEVIHSVCGPIKTLKSKCKRYCVTHIIHKLYFCVAYLVQTSPR